MCVCVQSSFVYKPKCAFSFQSISPFDRFSPAAENASSPPLLAARAGACVCACVSRRSDRKLCPPRVTKSRIKCSRPTERSSRANPVPSSSPVSFPPRRRRNRVCAFLCRFCCCGARVCECVSECPSAFSGRARALTRFFCGSVCVFLTRKSASIKRTTGHVGRRVVI